MSDAGLHRLILLDVLWPVIGECRSEFLINVLVVAGLRLGLLDLMEQPSLELLMVGVACGVDSELDLLVQGPELLGLVPLNQSLSGLDVPLVLSCVWRLPRSRILRHCV